MKKLFVVALIASLMCGMAVAQTFYPSWAGGVAQTNQVNMISVMDDSTNGYVPRVTGTNNRTSTAMVLPVFDEAWILTKVIPVTVDQDSTDINLLVQAKFTNETVTGYTARGNGWFQVDSSSIVTADTLGGDLKKIALPPGVDQVRVVWDGITGNDADSGNVCRSWLMLKY